MMELLGIIIISCLGLSTAQQMCVYQDHWSQPNSVITFDSVSTLFTSTIEDSRIDVSKVNTTGQIVVKAQQEYSRRITIMSMIVTVEYHYNDDDGPAHAQVYIQNNGKVALRGMYDKNPYSVDTIVGLPNSEVPTKKLGYLLLDTKHNVREFHETGYIRAEDTIRLVVGKLDDGYLDVSVCILSD